MAELLLKIDPGSGYSDGDVICAFNRRMIRSVHARYLCHPRLAGRTGQGLRPLDSLSRKFYELTHQFRFARVRHGEVLRTEIATGIETSITATPNAVGEYMHVEEYVKRRTAVAEHDVFGAAGREIWYGGRINFSAAVIESAWAVIASVTDRTGDEPEYQLWPMGRLDIRNHLAVRVVDFDDAQQEALVAPQFNLDGDGNPVGEPVAKRNIRVDWKTDLLDDLRVTEKQVRDREFPIGRDIEIASGQFRYESKDQPVQGDRAKLQSRQLGGRLPR